MTKLKKVANLYRYKDNNITLIGNVKKHYFLRTSEIMEDFLDKYEINDEDNTWLYLEERYGGNLTDLFKKNLNKYKDIIFEEETKPLNNYDLGYINTLTLNVSQLCNLRCTYCFETYDFIKEEKEVMTSEVAIKAINIFLKQLKTNKGKIIFTGGEPLIAFDVIKDSVDYIKKSNSGFEIAYMIKTNGLLMDEEIIKFLEENDFLIQLSLDGNKDAHDFHRVDINGNGSYDKVMSLLHRLLNAGVDRKNIVLHGTVTHQTISFFDKSLELINDLQRKHEIKASILPVMSSSNNNFTLTEDDHIKLSNYLYQRSIETYNLNNNFSANGKTNCGIGVSHVSIDSNGDIYPCYRLSGEKRFLLGNLQDGRLKYELHEDLRAIYEIDSNAKCQNCYGKIFCAIGCYAGKLLNNSIEKCNSVEKRYGDFILEEGLIKSKAYLSFSKI